MMNQADVDAIIAETFRLSGVKLTADDPIIPILLIMEGRLKALFAEQRVHTRQDFDEITAEIEEPLKAAVQIAEDLKTYREQIMADLLAGYGKELSESEGRISSSIQQKIAKQTQAHIDEVVANRKYCITQPALDAFLTEQENARVLASLESRSEQKCRSINAKTVSIILTSQRRAVRELDNLLAPKTSKKPKCCMTN